MIDNKDPFGFEASTYLWVVGVAMIAGLVSQLNRLRQFELGPLIIAGITSGLNGLIMFWICSAMNITGHWMAVSIAISGLMGSRAWTEFENFWRARIFGARPVNGMEWTEPLPKIPPPSPDIQPDARGD